MADKKNTKYVSNLHKRYKDTVVMGMMEHFSYKNVMEVPKVSHISINMGIGDAKDNPKKTGKCRSGINPYILPKAGSD